MIFSITRYKQNELTQCDNHQLCGVRQQVHLE